MGSGSKQAAWWEGTSEGGTAVPPQPHLPFLTWFPAFEGDWEERGPINEVGKGSLQ